MISDTLDEENNFLYLFFLINYNCHYEHWILANSNCCSVSRFIIWKRKISELMGDVAKGIKSFKKGMSDDPENKSISNNDNNKSES